DRRPICRAFETRVSALPAHTYRAKGLFLGTLVGGDSEPGQRLVVSASGNVCAWDGALHNRKSLAASSGVMPAEERRDAALALEIYERFGVDGLGELIGDWSLALWDHTAGRLHLASDYTGIRPLYFCEKGGALLWSSSLADLRRQTGCED